MLYICTFFPFLLLLCLLTFIPYFLFYSLFFLYLYTLIFNYSSCSWKLWEVIVNEVNLLPYFILPNSFTFFFHHCLIVNFIYILYLIIFFPYRNNSLLSSTLSFLLLWLISFEIASYFLLILSALFLVSNLTYLYLQVYCYLLILGLKILCASFKFLHVKWHLSIYSLTLWLPLLSSSSFLTFMLFPSTLLIHF